MVGLGGMGSAAAMHLARRGQRVVGMVAPVVGEILADLATTGTTPHGIALFDPGRFTGR